MTVIGYEADFTEESISRGENPASFLWIFKAGPQSSCGLTIACNLCKNEGKKHKNEYE